MAAPHALALATAGLWSVNAYVKRRVLVGREGAAGTLFVLRYACIALLLLLLLLLLGIFRGWHRCAGAGTCAWRERARGLWLPAAWLAAAGMASDVFVMRAYQSGEATATAITLLSFYTVPAAAGVMFYVLDGERLTARQGLGAGLLAAGAALLVVKGYTNG